MVGWMGLAEGVASFLFFLLLFPLSSALGGGPDPWLRSAHLVSSVSCILPTLTSPLGRAGVGDVREGV